MENFVDALVRTSAPSVVSPSLALRAGRATKKTPAFASIHDAWLHALRSADGRLSGDGAAARQLAEQIGPWQRPVLLTTAAPFRLCFRLEEPPESDEEEPGVAASDYWYVRYRLRQESQAARPRTAKLLAGEMPQDIEQAFQDVGLSLFPLKSADLITECSCPDWSNPCKHVAAVYYLLGEEFVGGGAANGSERTSRAASRRSVCLLGQRRCSRRCLRRSVSAAGFRRLAAAAGRVPVLARRDALARRFGAGLSGRFRARTASIFGRAPRSTVRKALLTSGRIFRSIHWASGGC